MSEQNLSQVLAKKQSILQGDAARIAKQRAAGKLTARERVAKLLDAGYFAEMDALVPGGAVTGSGTVQGKPVVVFAQDFTVHGGAMGETQAKKICKVLDMALKTGTPVVAMCDSAGVRIDEGAAAMNAYASVFVRLAKMSGVVPVVALILGPVVGGAAMIAQLADVSIQAEDVGQLMVYGPQVMLSLSGKAVDANQVSAEKVGGAKVMAAQGGVALTAENEDGAIALAAKLLDLLPASNAEDAEIIDSDDMNRLLPALNAADADALLAAMADCGSYVELYAAFGQEVKVALARVGGRTVGLVAGNAAVNEGMLTAEAASKAARFIRLCDCYSIPVVSLINSKGVAVPAIEHQAATIKATTQLLYAYAEATTAKVSIVIGNAIGQAYVAMGGKGNADVTYAWPGAVISALTPEAAVQVLYVDELKAGKAPALQTRAELEAKFAADVADGVAAACNGLVDDVIDPAQTRQYVIQALEMLASKRDANPPKKHGNLPL